MARTALTRWMVLFAACGLALVGACGDDAVLVSKQVRDFIVNVGTPDGLATSALVLGDQPEPSGGPTAAVEIGTATVLTGGGVSASVSSDVPFGRVLLYVGGAEDYFRLELPAMTSSTEVSVALAEAIPDASFSLRVACVDASGAVGDYIATTLTVQAAGSADAR